MKSITLIVAALESTFLAQVSPAGILDDTKRLVGQYIIEASELEQIHCPPFGKYDCLNWPKMYRTENGKCIGIDSYSLISGIGVIGILTISKDKALSLFTIASGIGGPDIKHHSVTFYECPDLF